MPAGAAITGGLCAGAARRRRRGLSGNGGDGVGGRGGHAVAVAYTDDITLHGGKWDVSFGIGGEGGIGGSDAGNDSLQGESSHHIQLSP